jgi:hypothetical protein
VTEGSTGIVAAGQTLTVSAHSGISLDSASNQVNQLNATNLGTGAVTFTNAPGALLTISGLNQAAGNVTVTADDMNITGAVSAAASAVTLRPTTLSRNTMIEASPTAGVLSLSQGELQQITATTLDIGRLDGSGNVNVNGAVNDANVQVGTLRFLAGNNFDHGSLSGIGAGAGTFSLEIRANNDVNLLNSGVNLGDNQSLTVVADNDTSGSGDVNIGAVTLQVGAGVGNSTGNMVISGRNIAVTTSGNVSGLVQVTGSGTQTFTAANNIALTNMNTASGSLKVLNIGNGLQTAVAGGLLSMVAGTGTGTSVELVGNLDQTVTANGLALTGGASGGGVGSGNSASLRAGGSQTVTVGNGGIELTGGSGTLSENYASIEQNGGAGTTQSITINGTGSIVLTGGSAQGVRSHASIKTDNGDSQTITFTGGGSGRAITLTGGTNGMDAYAEIYAGTGIQTITGAGLVSLTGGASGGGASFGGGDTLGNLASIGADLNNQTIAANGIVLQGGGAGLNNLAGIFGGGDQLITIGAGGLSLTGGGGGVSDLKNAAIILKSSDVPGTSQTITIGGGGLVRLQGGSASGSNVGTDIDFGGLSNGAFAAIRSEGVAQLIEFTAPGGSIQMTGGTVGSDNHAMILAQTGSQTIRGTVGANAPALVLTGGASGGLGGTANEGNRAMIYAEAGNQDIAATSISLTGGANGVENLAQLRQGTAGSGEGSTQTISIGVGGTLSMLGGADGTFNFARIRSHGTAQLIEFAGPGGSINMTGGSAGTSNFANVHAVNGSQTIRGITAADAPGFTLLGGSGGTDNRAEFSALLGNQVIAVGAGGLSLVGGSGGGSDLRNVATLYHNGPLGTSQTVTVGGGGDLTLQGGSSAGTGGFNGSLAYFSTSGDLQLIEFSAPGSTISITGGTVGSFNTAGFFAFNGDQTIRGTTAANAPAITLVGGASGGISGEGNYAEVTAPNGNQTIIATSIDLTGGATGVENRAVLLQGGVSTGLTQTQTVTILGGGSLSLQGGSGTINLARIQSYGQTQTVAMAAGGTIDLTGGTGASLNFARIVAENGDQFITGTADITVSGGANGGSIGNGHHADIRQRNVAKVQSISAGALLIHGGDAGVENVAALTADGNQIVTANRVALTGGDTGDTNRAGIVSNSGSQTIAVGASGLSVAGGGGSVTDRRNFASIFQGGLAGTSQTITVNGGGSITLQGGNSAGTNVGIDNGS